MSQLTAPNLFIEAANGTSYAYRRFGKVGSVPVVFLQHFRGNLDNWDPTLVDAIATEREVVLVDNSGVGLSNGSTPKTAAGLATDILDFIDVLGLTEIDLFGFSMGGFVAQEIALRRPRLVHRLILAGTGPEGGRGFHVWLGETGERAYRDAQSAEDALYLFFSATENSRAKGSEFVERIFTRQEDRDETPTLSARDAHSEVVADWGIPDMGRLARLAGIAQPTLVANGDNDIMVPTVNSYLLAGHIPDAKLVIYPDAGHGFLFQYPAEFAAVVNAFLSTVDLDQ